MFFSNIMHGYSYWNMPNPLTYFWPPHGDFYFDRNQSTCISHCKSLLSWFWYFVGCANVAFYRLVRPILKTASEWLIINLKLYCLHFHCRALKTESSHSWEIFAKIVQFEKDLEIEILKVRNSYLLELFQISWKIQSFDILQSCFASRKQDELRTGTSLNLLLRFESAVIVGLKSFVPKKTINFMAFVLNENSH